MLNQLLLDGAAARPDQPLVIASGATATYADVAARAATLATGLAARDITRFGCLVVDIADLIALMAASSAVAAEACMYPRAAGDDEAARLAEHFDHSVLITDSASWPSALAVDDLAVEPAGDELTRQPAASPLLILTTGTTGLPKGARNDWVRLVSTHKNRVGPADARWLLAHVPNQFAGLGVLLHCLASGATLIVPDAYQPRDALDAMRAHGVTHVSATPTFWRFLLSRLEPGEQLPVRQITMAGEAVPSALLSDLYTRFPDARISQIYGATEFGSSVAVGDAQHGMPARVLERGDDAEVQFRIVDGELQVRSSIGMLGYYGSEDVGDSWRPTGDLVEVRGDRIFFVGRATEIINVGGVKVTPLPIEDIVGRVDGVQLAHVYGRSSPVTGQIVAVDVVVEPGADPAAVETAIRAACADLPAASQPRRIRIVDDLVIRDTKIARRRPDET
jgi:acyl-CoA synthetase (AMP-forming)/AMP-acid ligase II